MNESNWSQFGGDPTPGGILDIQRAISFVKDVKAKSSSLLDFFKRIQNQEHQIVWEGLSAKVFREEMSALMPDILKLTDASDELIATFSRYESELEPLKVSSKLQLLKALEAQTSINGAQYQIRMAQNAINDARNDLSNTHLENQFAPHAVIERNEAIIHQAKQLVDWSSQQLVEAVRAIDNLRVECNYLRRDIANAVHKLSAFSIHEESLLSRLIGGVEIAAKVILRTELKTEIAIERGVETVGSWIYEEVAKYNTWIFLIGMVLSFTPLAPAGDLFMLGASAVGAAEGTKDFLRVIKEKIYNPNETNLQFAQHLGYGIFEVVSNVAGGGAALEGLSKGVKVMSKELPKMLEEGDQSLANAVKVAVKKGASKERRENFKSVDKELFPKSKNSSIKSTWILKPFKASLEDNFKVTNDDFNWKPNVSTKDNLDKLVDRSVKALGSLELAQKSEQFGLTEGQALYEHRQEFIANFLKITTTEFNLAPWPVYSVGVSEGSL